MELSLRPVSDRDLPLVLELNEQALPQVNRIDLDTIRWFARTAAYFRVAEMDRQLAAFLIAITPQTDYPSQYFGWFRQRYTDFLYIDRIVVAPWARHRGLGWALYRDLEQVAGESGYTLATEVYSDPPNHVSLAFHAKFGFEQVGTQVVEDGGIKMVAKFLKRPLFN
jgi:predicted GNAT superfamily acetyltransferase